MKYVNILQMHFSFKHFVSYLFGISVHLLVRDPQKQMQRKFQLALPIMPIYLVCLGRSYFDPIFLSVC